MIVPSSLERAVYFPYGDLIAVEGSLPHRVVNLGTARRYDHLARIENLRPGHAPANLGIFRCQARLEKTIPVPILERHVHSTQVFLPMSGVSRYLVVVALGDSIPDLATLKAFIAGPDQGVSYRPGVWHFPLMSLGTAADFACLVHEDGSEEDCEIHTLASPLEISVAKAT